MHTYTSKDTSDIADFSYLHNILKDYTVGFDNFFQKVQELQQSFLMDKNYPPYNIKKLGVNKYAIELAVAGFAKNEIEIELDGSVLNITGKSKSIDENGEENYYYKGIANRAFSKRFAIADTISINDADFFNGILRIWFENIIPKPSKKKIEIKG